MRLLSFPLITESSAGGPPGRRRCRAVTNRAGAAASEPSLRWPNAGSWWLLRRTSATLITPGSSAALAVAVPTGFRDSGSPACW